MFAFPPTSDDQVPDLSPLKMTVTAFVQLLIWQEWSCGKWFPWWLYNWLVWSLSGDLGKWQKCPPPKNNFTRNGTFYLLPWYLKTLQSNKMQFTFTKHLSLPTKPISTMYLTISFPVNQFKEWLIICFSDSIFWPTSGKIGDEKFIDKPKDKEGNEDTNARARWGRSYPQQLQANARGKSRWPTLTYWSTHPHLLIRPSMDIRKVNRTIGRRQFIWCSSMVPVI